MIDMSLLTHKDWLDLCETPEMVAKAKAIIASLKLDETGTLLGANTSTIRTLLSCFRSLAQGHFVQQGIAGEQLDEWMADPLIPAEIGLEGNGLLFEGAALYALEHDQLLADDSEMARFIRCLLRYKLARLLAELDASRNRLASKMILVEEAVRWLRGWPAVPNMDDESVRIFGCRLFIWLGIQRGQLNQYSASAEAFSTAATMAEDVNQCVQLVAQSAMALGKGGDRPAALRTLLSVHDQLDDVTDSDILEGWELVYGGLRMEMGGRSQIVMQTAEAEELSVLSRRWLSTDQAPSSEQRQGLVESVQAMAADAKENSPAGRLRTLLVVLPALLGDETHAQQAESMMAQAAALDAEVQDAQLHLDFLILRARCLTSQDAVAAVSAFQALLSEVRDQRDSEQQLIVLGHYAVAMMRSLDAGVIERASVLQVTGLCQDIETLYREQLAQRPSTPERRQLRERLQRSIETAVLAACTVGDMISAQSVDGQQALAAAWSLMHAARNPTLSEYPADNADELSTEHQSYRDAFHRALEQRSGRGKTASWHAPLEALYDYELAYVSPTWVETKACQPVHTKGIHTVQLRVRELFSHERPFIVMCFQHGVYSATLVERIDAPLETLRTWHDDLELGLEPDNGLAIQALHHLLAIDAVDHLTDADSSYLYLEPEMANLALDVLYPAVMNQTHFMPTTHILALSREMRAIELDQGVLTVAEIPQSKWFNALPATQQEVDHIAAVMSPQYLYRLTGTDAHTPALITALNKHRPTVLHLACHGIANTEYPEASALVLAPHSVNKQRYLLTFRDIQQLPLQGIQLVVLSACSSSLGPGSRSAGLEGLVWAFLDADAQAVLASRYPVNDVDTAEFMGQFYAQLDQYRPDYALAHCRDVCRAAGMAENSLAAWSLWS